MLSISFSVIISLVVYNIISSIYEIISKAMNPIITSVVEFASTMIIVLAHSTDNAAKTFIQEMINGQIGILAP